MLTPNTLGAYSPPEGQEIDPLDFFKANFPVIGKYFDMSEDEIEVDFFEQEDGPKFYLGTQSMPIRIMGKVLMPGLKLHALFNTVHLNLALIPSFHKGGITAAAGVLWHYIVMTFRSVLLKEGVIPKEEYVGASAYDFHGLRAMHEANTEDFLTSDTRSGEDMRISVDTYFIGAYVTGLVCRIGTRREPFELDRIVKIIRDTRRSNVEQLPHYSTL
jgi:hypothetical protein